MISHAKLLEESMKTRQVPHKQGENRFRTHPSGLKLNLLYKDNAFIQTPGKI